MSLIRKAPAKSTAVQLGNTNETEYNFEHKLESWATVLQVRSAADNKVCEVGQVLSGGTATLVSLKVVDDDTTQAVFSAAPGNGAFVLTVVG